jgi:hypothetical protein
MSDIQVLLLEYKTFYIANQALTFPPPLCCRLLRDLRPSLRRHAGSSRRAALAHLLGNGREVMRVGSPHAGRGGTEPFRGRFERIGVPHSGRRSNRPGRCRRR